VGQFDPLPEFARTAPTTPRRTSTERTNLDLRYQSAMSWGRRVAHVARHVQVALVGPVRDTFCDRCDVLQDCAGSGFVPSPFEFDHQSKGCRVGTLLCA